MDGRVGPDGGLRDVPPQDGLEAFASEAIAYLRDYFGRGGFGAAGQDKGQQTDARIAVAALSAWTRMQQTRGAGRALDYQMARDLAADKNELRRYMEVSLPDHGLVRLIKSEAAGAPANGEASPEAP